MVHHTSTGDSWSVCRLVAGDSQSGGQIDSRSNIQLTIEYS
jgi:hypothetical protein